MKLNAGKYSIDRVGRLVSSRGTLQGVRCDVEVPARDAGDIRVNLRWEGRGSVPAMDADTFEFDTEIDAKGPWARQRLRLVGMHVFEASHRGGDSETTALADAQGVELTDFHGRTQRAEGSSQRRRKKTHISLFLTPNRMLYPFRMSQISYRGTIKQDRGQLVQVTAQSLAKVTFDFHYDWESSEDQRERKTLRYLVANLKAAVPAESRVAIETEVLTPFEDLLLLAGFGSRTPTRCCGWIAVDDATSSEYFRRGLVLPTGRQRHRTIVNGGLVALADFPEFLEKGIAAFRRSKVQESLRQAFYALANSAEQTIEQSFLSLFSAFEGLIDGILGDAKRARFEEDRGVRERARARLEVILGQWVARGEISEEVKRQLSAQIGRVQTISLAERYSLLQATTRLATTDLWPVIGKGDTMSLYRIRNRLSHGTPMEQRHCDALMVAGHHIEWLLERLVCAVLEWDLGRTDLSDTRSYWPEGTVNWQEAERQFRS